MIEIEINGKEYKIPQTFSELKFKDYCRCFQGLADTDELEGYDKFRKVKENEAAILSRLMGEQDDFALDLPVSIYAVLADTVHFIYNVDSIAYKSSVEIKGRTYICPKPEQFSLRQWVDSDITMQDKENPLQFIELLGVLLVPIGEDGKPEPYKGEYKQLMTVLGEMTCDKTLPLVMYFFRKGRLLSRLTLFSSKIKEVENQLLQAIRNSLSSTTGSI